MSTTDENTQPSVSAPSGQAQTPTAVMKTGVNYSFYLHDAFTNDSLGIYQDLISAATSKVTIWDPYIHDTDMKVFGNIHCGLNITILTMSSYGDCWNKKNLDVTTSLKLNLPPEFKADCRFDFAYIDKSRHGGSSDQIWQFHDRFLIIDDQDYYIIGSSIDHHVRRQQSTGIMKVEHQEDKSLIQEAFNKTYKIAELDNTRVFYSNLQ